MKRNYLVLTLLTACLFAGSGILSANGLNLNGVGSRAIAMGGAYVGLADDYSAIYWNPAGLSQIKTKSLSIFQTTLIPTSTYQFAMARIDTETKSTLYPSGALGFVKPVSEKLTLGILAYVPSGSGARWNGEDLKALSSNTAYEWKSLIAWPPYPRHWGTRSPTSSPSAPPSTSTTA